MNSYRVLIDYDVLVYASSFSCQKSSYVLDGVEYATKKELKEKHPNYKEEDVSIFTQLEPASHAVQCCRMMLQSILEACAPVKEYKGYLTGPGNFRYALATIQPYKGTRKQDKPIHFDSVREFLLRECNAELVEGIEADDKLCIEWLKSSHDSIVATIDKDLSQIEGIRIYNWKKKELAIVDPIVAKRNFWKQALTGDSTDAITGCPGIGEAKAAKLLDSIKEEKIMATLVYAEYMKVYGKKAWEYLTENARLLYMLRSEDDLKDPANAWKPVITPQGI